MEFVTAFTAARDRLSSPPFPVLSAGLLWRQSLDTREDREDGSRCRCVPQDTDPVDD
jgi:hypothetical protein